MACGRFLRATVALSVAAQASLAHACTVCDSPAGHQVRSGLFHDHFVRTLFAVASPMPVLLGAVLLFSRLMPDLDGAHSSSEVSLPTTPEPAL